MNSSARISSAETELPPEIRAMQSIFNAQKASYEFNPNPSAIERVDRLQRLRQAIVTNNTAICDAICQDFGNRSPYETKLAEIMTVVDHIDSTSKHVAEWMKPSKRKISNLHMPAKGWVEYQPLGVVGIMSPWNYPLLLSVGPLICALAAGNHAMLKISSAASAFGETLERILAEVFQTNIVAVINGGGVISDTFAHLPFDLICFTGSPEIGKTVMAAAATNLTPVILELGGKSPAIIHESADIAEAAERITFGKFWNAGQTCVAPDYVFIPEGRTAEFIMEVNRYFAASYKTILDNSDYTSIVNQKQYERLTRYLDDAETKGAEITTINPAYEDLTGSRKIAPKIICNPTEDMLVAKEEIFGPLLLVREYKHLDEALMFINNNPRPLALYYFDRNEDRIRHVIEHTHSGHIGLNTTLTHVAQDDLPFGGIGNSGMGKYHGREGFFAMSHGRSVMSVPKFLALRAIFPPFGSTLQKMILRTMIR